MRSNGHGLRRLTHFQARREVAEPVWSQNGRWIAFVRPLALYVMRSEGPRLRRIFDAERFDSVHPEQPWTELSAPSWQPLVDGRR